MSAAPLGVYVHWPFCKSKCPYCDFNSHVRDGVEQARYGQRATGKLGAALGHHAHGCTHGRGVNAAQRVPQPPQRQWSQAVWAAAQQQGRTGQPLGLRKHTLHNEKKK